MVRKIKKKNEKSFMNLKKFSTAYKEEGIKGFLNVLLGKIGFKYRLIVPSLLIKNSLDQKIISLEEELKSISKNKVMSVLYKNLKLNNFLSRSNKNFNLTAFNLKSNCSQILGLYEKEVQDYLAKYNYKTLINIGCGDGYHLIGNLFKNKKKKAIGFEIDIKARQNLIKNAKINNCYDRIELIDEGGGGANEKFLDILLKKKINFEKSFFLIDIEGQEFNILNNKNLKKLKQTKMIVELHGNNFGKNNSMKLENDLLNNLKNYFNIKIFQTGARDLSIYKELRDYNDLDRWLMVSENRPWAMRWVLCLPK